MQANDSAGLVGDTSGVVWLQLDYSCLPDRETVEYSIKKPLFAASVTIDIDKDRQAGQLTLRSSIQAKIPLLGTKDIQITSVRSLADVAAFSLYEEKLAGKVSRVWSREGSTLTLAKGSEVLRRFELAEESSTLLTSLSLLGVLTSSLPVQGDVFASQFVVTGKIFAVHLRKQASQVIILAREIETPIGSAQWLALDWSQAHRIEGHWDAAANAVTSLKVKVPVLGHLEIPLTRHSRA